MVKKQSLKNSLKKPPLQANVPIYANSKNSSRNSYVRHKNRPHFA